MTPLSSVVHTVAGTVAFAATCLRLMSPLNKATDTVGKCEDGVSSSTYSIIRCLLRDSLKISSKVQSVAHDVIARLITSR